MKKLIWYQKTTSLYQSEHVSDIPTHGSDTIEDNIIVDLIQVPRGDVAEIIVGSVTNEQEISNEKSVYENTRLWLCTRFWISSFC